MELSAIESQRLEFRMQYCTKRVKEHFSKGEKREREHLEIQEIGSSTKQTKRKSPSNVATHLDPENSQSRWGYRMDGSRRNGTKSKTNKNKQTTTTENTLDAIERMFLALAQFVDDIVIHGQPSKNF